MATKKGFTLYYIDPETGKRKLARTKEQNRLARQQQQKKMQEIKKQQKEQRLQGAIKLSQAKKTRNPRLYANKTVSPQSGKLVTKKQRAAEIRKKNKKRRTWSRKRYKEFALNVLNESNGKAKQALDDLNAAGSYYNSVYGKASSEIKDLLNRTVGAINADSTYDDFYNENYRKVMLPNMLKEIRVYQKKFERGLEALYEYATGLKGDELAECLQIIDELSTCIEICSQSETEYQRQIITAGEEEPEQPHNLHLSGI